MHDKEQLIKNLNELLYMAQAKLNLQQSKLDKHLASVQDFKSKEQATAWDNQKERLRIKLLNWVIVVVWLTQEINELDEDEEKPEDVKFWLAREKDGKLFLHYGDNQPIKHEDLFWFSDGDHTIYLDKHLFPQVKWSDKEPTKVKLVLKK